MSGYQQIQLTPEQLAYLEQVQRQQQAQVLAYQQQQAAEQAALLRAQQVAQAQAQAQQQMLAQAQIQENTMHARAIADQVLRMQPQAQYAPPGVNPNIAQNSFQAQQIAQRVAEMQEPYVVEEAPASMTYGDWGYLLLAFVIFSVSLAIVRRQFSTLAKKTNVRKAVKKRFGGIFGGANANGAADSGERPENVDSLGMGTAGKKENDRRDENLIVDGDNEASSGRKKITYTDKDPSTFAQGLHYLQSSVGQVIGAKKKAKNSDDENEDPCEYEVLDDCNSSKDSRVNLGAPETKTMWTKDGPKTVDHKGNLVAKKEESKQNDVLDGSKEGDDHESPVALLSAMDLNCDDGQINTLLHEGAESGSRGSSPNEDPADKSDLNSNILKKLYSGGKPARKAAVVVDDDEPDHDPKGELSTATDQASIDHVVDELNDLMNVGAHEVNEEPAFMKIDDAL